MRRKIRFGILLMMAVTLSSVTALGQIFENYRFDTGTTTSWNAVTDELIGSGVDDGVSAVTDIGFTFYYDGVPYTQFSVNSNGNLKLGSEVIASGGYSSPLGSNYTTNAPKIVGVGRDCSTGAAGYVKTGYTGNNNNKIRTVDFLLHKTASSSGTDYIQFQILLFQGSNEIRIVYSKDTAHQSVPSSYQIGLVNADASKMWVVNPSTHEASYFTSANSSTYSVFPGTGRYYSFIPDPLKTIGAATSLPYACDFENTTENGRWAFGNSVDGWSIGSATNNGGSKSLYVSNDGGTTNAYNSATQFIYAIRALNVQATGTYTVSYNWKCQGENGYDFLRAFLVPASLSPNLSGYTQVYANNITKTSYPSGWISIDGETYLGRQTEWQTISQTVTLSSTGTYYLVFYWRSDGSNQGGDYNPPAAVDNVSVRYLPVAASVPYTCNFETASENSKWTLANGLQTNYWMIGGSTYNSSSNSLYITNDGSSNSYTIASAISYVYAYRNLTFASAGDYVVSFKWKGYGEGNYDYLRAFLVPASVETLDAGNTNSISTANTPTDWIAVDGGSKLNVQSGWQVNSQTVNVPTAGEYNLVFYWRNDNSQGTQPPVAIDDIEVAAPCTATATVLADVQGSSSVIINRTNGSDGDYQLLITSSTDPTTATETPLMMTSSSMTITGLAEHTYYNYYIRSYCSEYRVGEWSSRRGFWTRHVPTTIPYTCDFENSTENSKWVLANDGQANTWEIGGYTYSSASNSLYITGGEGEYEYNYTGIANVYAYRNINFTSAGDYVVSFKWKGYGEGNYDFMRAFLVPVSVQTLVAANTSGITTTNTPSGWIAVDGGSKLNLQSDWQVCSHTVTVPTAGEYYLAFYWRNNTSSGTQPPAAVDDIEVDTPCTASAAITASADGYTSATITRTSGSGIKYEILVSTSSDPDAATETPVEMTSTTQAVTNLTEGTQYYAFIRSYCSEYRPGPWSSPVSFETESAFRLPYYQDFESGVADGWTLSVGSYGSNDWHVGSSTANESEYSMYISQYGIGNSYDNVTSNSYAYCKLLVEESGLINVAFDWKANGEANYDVLRAFMVPVSANPVFEGDNGMAGSLNTAPDGWIEASQYNSGMMYYNINWRHSSKNLVLSDAGQYYLVFFWKNNATNASQPPAAVDNISVEFLTSCLPVTNVTASNITKRSVDLSWTAGGSETQWQVLVGTSTPENSTETPMLVNTNSTTVSGLNNTTYYKAYVRAYCSESDQSPWSSVCSFKTLDSCKNVSDLTITEVMPTTATLTWTSPDTEASQWEVVVNQSSEATEGVVASMVVNSTTATITGLTPSTDYYVHVRCDCGEDGYSRWITEHITTLDEAITLPYTENFEGQLPSQWVLTHDATNNWYVGRATNNGGSRAMYVSNNDGASYSYNIGSSSDSYAYFSFGVEETCLLNVSYDWKCNGESEYDFARAFVVPISLGPTSDGITYYSEPSDWIPVDDGQMVGSESWTRMSKNVLLDPGYYYLVFYWENDGSVGTQPPAAIDNLSVSVATTCIYSTDVDVSDEGKTTAYAYWGGGSGSVSHYEMLVTTASNPDEATETPITVNTDYYELSGLEPDTHYYLYVRGVCSESSKGVWYSTDFTTLPSCIPLSGVNFGVITKTTIEMFLENEDPDASQWEVLVTTASSIENATESSHIVDNLNPTIEGLTPGTQYSVYARTYCSATDQSEWLSVGTFTTSPACIDVMDVTVDSYGKTWVTASWTNIDSDATQWQVLVSTATNATNATEDPVLVSTNPATIDNLETNTTYYVYVRAYCSESAQSEWVRSSSFKTYPPCVPPTNISAVVNSNEVNLTWKHDYLHSISQMYHLYLSEVEMSEAELNALTSSEYISRNCKRHNYSGLIGGQTYHLYLRAVCVEGDYSDWTHFPFTTPTDEVMPLPYYQDFEGDIVENWHLANGTSNNCWFFGAAVGKDSDKSLYVTSLSYSDVGWATVSGTSYVYAYCRLHVDQPCVINVSFDWNCQGSSNGAGALRAFMIPSSVGPHIYGGTNVSNANGMNGTSTATPDGWIDVSEGVSDGLMWGANSWVRNSKNLVLSEPDDYYFVLFNRTYSTGRPAAVDNLSVEVVSTCIYPQNVSLDSFGKTTATLSWERVTDESQWQVLATTADSPEEATETPVLVDNLNPTIEGLIPGTQYSIYVRTYCSSTNQSEWVSGGTFTTLPACIPVQYVHLDDYGKTWCAVSWTNVDEDASQWQVLATTADSPEEATETPMLVDDTTATISNLEMNTHYNVYVRSYCSESSQSTWKWGASFTTMPPCEPVYDLNAVVTPTSAKIRWLHPYNRANYYTIFSETALTAEQLAVASYQTTSDRYWNLNDLTPGTTYHEYVAVDCYDGDMSDWVHLEFTTPEQEAMPLPYYENFDDGVAQNWITSNNGNGWFLGSAIADESPMSMYISPDYGATYMYSESYHSFSYAYCRLNIDHPCLINLSYDWTGEGHGVNAHMRTFLIPTSLNPNLTAGNLNGISAIAMSITTPEGWIEMGTPYPVQSAFFNSGADTGWLRSNKDVTISEPGDYYLVYFWGNNAWNGSRLSAAVDNISVTHVSDCIFVGNISVDEVRREDATVSWTYLDGSQWEVLVSRSSNAASATETPVLVSSPSYTAQNLVASTTYYVYVRTYCSESEQSPWSGSVSFTTLPPCETINGIVNAYINGDEAAVFWSQPFSYNNFHVILSQTEMSEEELNASAYELIDETRYYADGLTPGQGYHVYISSVCSSFDNSEWYDYYFETPEYFTIPYHEDFDSNVIYGWYSQPDGYNWWTIGSATSTNGSQSLYITNDGNANEYNVGSTTYAYAYCPIYIDRAGLIKASFDWRANGEWNYDYMRVFLAPADINLSGNIGIGFDVNSSSSLPSGCMSLEGGANFCTVEDWAHVSNVVRINEPGLYNLVYYWKNDNSMGGNPPGAVDDITIVWISEENDILSFNFDGAENVQIDTESHTVTCLVPYSMNLRAVRPTITISDYATISPASGATVNLNNPFVYTVTAESGDAQEWTVVVSRNVALVDAEILSFWTEGLVDVTIDSENATVNATISRMYDISSLVPTIEISDLASIDQVVGRAYDFSEPVVFAVTAEDGITTKLWTINVSYYDTPLGVDCTNPYIVDAENDLPYVHTSSTEGMMNMLNTYFSDSPSNQMTLPGNDVVYRIDVENRKMLVVSTQSYSGNFSVFVMNTCGTRYSDKVASNVDASDASFTIDCRPGSYFVIIDSNNDDVSYEIQIQEQPYCYVVEDLDVTRLQDELDVAWSSDNIGDTWTVKYGLSGFDVETEGSLVNVSAPHCEITGLTESTLYDIYVRANCAGANGNSEWTLISASTIASCQTPEALTADVIMDNEATISWNGFNMTQWEFGYKLSSETEYSTMIVNENSVNLTDLQYSTTYNVRVRSVCDGDYSGYAEYTFTTMCFIVRTYPYTEDFGSGTFPPLCWSQERTAAGSGMGVGYANGAWMSASATVGGNATTKAMLADTKAGSVHNLVTTGMIFADNLNGYSISLDIYRSSVSVASFDEGVEVWVNSSPDIVNGNPQMLGYVSKNYQHSSGTIAAEDAPGWYTYNFIARNRTGLNYVILVGKSNNAGGVYVDNLVIDKTVDCLPPSSLVLQSSGDDNVVLTWSDDNAITGNWTINYSLNGGDEVEATVDVPAITINGLLPNTTYQISAQIQSVCAAGMESELYEASIEATTGCAIMDIPYSENFDEDGETIDCWTSVSDGNNVWDIINGMAHIASASVQNNAHLISPRFNMSGDERYMVEFDVLQSRLNVSRPDSLFVLFIKDETEIDTLRSVAIQNAAINGMTQISVAVPQTDGIGRFDFALNGYRECSIDNFVLRTLSNQAEILTFEIEEQTEEPVIDSDNATISVSVVLGPEQQMYLAPTFTISENATVDVPSGTWRYFDEPVEYVVTAEDGVTTKTWTVSVTIDQTYCENPSAESIEFEAYNDSAVIFVYSDYYEESYNLKISSQPIDPETETADLFDGTIEPDWNDEGWGRSVIEALEAYSNYYLYIQSNCGTTEWTGKTVCGVLSLPYEQDFLSDDCW